MQAPQNGGPFILTDQTLPQLLETLNSRTQAARFIANCFIGVGVAIVTFRAFQATFSLIKRRRARYPGHIMSGGCFFCSNASSGGVMLVYTHTHP